MVTFYKIGEIDGKTILGTLKSVKVFLYCTVIIKVHHSSTILIATLKSQRKGGFILLCYLKGLLTLRTKISNKTSEDEKY